MLKKHSETFSVSSLKYISHYYSHHLDNVWMDGVWRCYIFKKNLHKLKVLISRKCRRSVKFSFLIGFPRMGFLLNHHQPFLLLDLLSVFLVVLLEQLSLHFRCPFFSVFCWRMPNVFVSLLDMSSPLKMSFEKKKYDEKSFSWHIFFPPIGGTGE